MNVNAVMQEIGQKLDAIPGLRVTPYTADKVPTPGAVVGLPDQIDYDQTYGRGSDVVTLPVWVMVARIDDRSSNTELAAYLDGSGAKSVKAAVDSSDANTYTACDSVRVQSADPGVYRQGGADLLGVEFTVDIRGRGQVT